MINLIGAYIFTLLLYAIYVERDKMRRWAANLERLPLWGRALLCPLLALLGLQHANILPPDEALSVLGILYTLVSGFTIWIHEAGHIYFRFFGRFMMFFGGTLNELLFPALLAWWGQRNRFSMIRALAICWIGLNLLRMSFYIADARAMKGRLLGASDTKGHDWNNMLSMLGLLDSDQTFAAAATSIGAVVLLAGMIFVFIRISPDETE